MTEPHRGRHSVAAPDVAPPPTPPTAFAAPTSEHGLEPYAPPGYAPGYAPQSPTAAPAPDPFHAQRTALPQPMPQSQPMPQPPSTYAPQPVAPQTYAPQPVAPQTYAPQPVAPQPVAPQTYAPQPVVPQTYAPQPVAPQSVTPESMQGSYVPSRSGATTGRHGADQWGNVSTPRLITEEPTSRRRLVLAGGVAVALVALLAGFLVVRGRNQAAVAADAAQAPATMDVFAAGYSTVTGPHGFPLAVGIPWGARCAPVVLSLDVTAPDAYVAAGSEVVDQAHGAGVNVAFGDSSGSYDASKLTGAKDDGSNVHSAVVHVSMAVPPKDAAGAPLLESFAWSTSLAADGRHETLTQVVVTIYDRTAGNSDVRRRSALRSALGMAQGISGSDKPGSGLYRDPRKASDILTDNDILAIRTMSGCTA